MSRITFSGLVIILWSSLLYPSFDVNKLTWPWDEIDTAQITFPSTFLWGAATSAYQVEGDCENNWTCSYEQLKQINPDYQLPGRACDHWHTYKEDIRLLKQAGLNTFRFSCAWEKIEPKEGMFDQDALDHYVDVCKTCAQHNIKPVLTLYHYTEPIWFYNKGGFEKKENIAYFVRYCQKLFEHLQPYIHLWCTFNAPSGIALKGWYKGRMPPFKKDLQLALKVLYHVLEAHVQVYQAFKAMPDGNEANIGILKNIYQIDPFNPYNPLDVIAARMAYKIADQCIYDFFTTGEFKLWIPMKAHIKRKNNTAPETLDFIGLNYYSHTFVHNFIMGPKPDEMQTDNPLYVIYGEGLYRAIKTLSDNLAKPLGIPIYVSENGISTQQMDHRELFYKRYLFALSKAIEDGYDVRGYITWALMDSYTYSSGSFDRTYGIYAIDFNDPTLKRTLKNDPGTRYVLSLAQ